MDDQKASMFFAQIECTESFFIRVPKVVPSITF